jgi:hypothetical protein
LNKIIFEKFQKGSISLPVGGWRAGRMDSWYLIFVSGFKLQMLFGYSAKIKIN